jgi:Fic family protein
MRDFLTYKSGKFYFCDVFDEPKITNLLVQAIILNETVVDLPILPELASRLEPDIKYRSISGTAMLEGNSIIDNDVKKIDEGEDLDKYTKKDKQEIKNLIEAYKWLSSNPSQILTEEAIKELHAIITDQVHHEHNVPGQYRNGAVYVGDKSHGGIYTPPKILDDVKNLMAIFIEWINSNTLHPYIKAALTHYHFSLIHPFWDGNGRTARLLEAVILQAANIKYVPKELSNYYYRNIDDYYAAFSKSIHLKKDVTPFLEFMLNGSITSLKSIKESIIYFIRKFAVREFYASEKKHKRITRRQFDLLLLLLDNHVEFTLKDLQNQIPFSILYRKISINTARMDLKKLTDRGILTTVEGNKFQINFRVLG